MTARNEHLALKAAGLVYVTGWIVAEHMPYWQAIKDDALPIRADALAVKRKRGRPRKVNPFAGMTRAEALESAQQARNRLMSDVAEECAKQP